MACDTISSGAMVVVVVELAPPVSSQSLQLSLRAKNTPTPIMETQIRKSEMRSKTFRPNLSMIRVVTNVPRT